MRDGACVRGQNGCLRVEWATRTTLRHTGAIAIARSKNKSKSRRTTIVVAREHRGGVRAARAAAVGSPLSSRATSESMECVALLIPGMRNGPYQCTSSTADPDRAPGMNVDGAMT
jgi:hypothetical protein